MLKHPMWASTIIGSVIASTPAWAQTSEQPAQEAGVGIEEIVVTAQRRAESAQRAPIAISAVGAEALANVANAAELTRLVPSVQIAPAQGATMLFYVRGVGSLATNSLTDPAVTVSLDGVPMARAYQGAGQMFDLDRVEVLKGPQGTLYGRNATGGAVNFIPTRPKLGEFGGTAGLEIGNYDLFKVNGALNIPLGDSVAVRAAFTTTNRDGYLSDGADDDVGDALRMQLLYKPSSDFSANLSFDYYHRRGLGSGGASLTGTTLTPFGPVAVPGFAASARVGSLDPRLDPLYAANLQSFDPSLRHANDKFYGITGTLEWRTGIGTLTVIPAWRRASLDNYSHGGFGVNVRETDVQKTLEVRLASNTDSRLRWIVGAFYLKDEVDSLTGIEAGNPFPFGTSPFGFSSRQTFSADTESLAAFVDGTFDISDTLRILGGVRYTREKKSIDDVQLTDAAPSATNPIVVRDSATFQEPTWRVGVQWDWASSNMLYATVSRGFHSGGFFATHDDPTYDPEFLTAYTVGSKNRFMNGRLQLNAEAFYWKYSDQQFSHVTFDSVGSAIFATENIGAVTIKGIEAEAQFLPAENTLLGVQVQYLDAKYDEFAYNQPLVPPSSGCASSIQGTPGFPIYNVNCAGRRPPQSPEWTLNLMAQQTIPLANGASLVAEVRSHYQSKTATSVEDVPITLQDAYWLTDLALTYRARNDAWSLTAYVNNVTDEVVIGNTVADPFSGIFGSPLYFAQLRPPRTYGLRLAAKF